MNNLIIGSLYIIENKKCMVKIGITHNIEKSMKSIERASGIDIMKIKLVDCENQKYEMNYILKKYENNRTFGDWIEGITFETIADYFNSKFKDLKIQEYFAYKL